MSDRGFEILLERRRAIGPWVKPSGIATQAPPGHREPGRAELRPIWPQGRTSGPTRIYLGIPHRLDRPVSGAMLFAQNAPRAARPSFPSSSSARRVERKRIGPRSSGWSSPSPAPGPTTSGKFYGQAPRRQLVEHTHPGGQEAILHYQTRGFHRAGGLARNRNWRPAARTRVARANVVTRPSDPRRRALRIAHLLRPAGTKTSACEAIGPARRHAHVSSIPRRERKEIKIEGAVAAGLA